MWIEKELFSMHESHMRALKFEMIINISNLIYTQRKKTCLKNNNFCFKT
jgi:hypothetical protein